MARSATEVLVIGAGIVGCSIALELSRAGRDVVVVDRAGAVGHGSTSASSGIVRFHYSTYAGVAVSWESVHAWMEWADHVGHLDPSGLAAFERTGILVLDPAREASRSVTTLFDEVGVPWEPWDAETIARRLPHVDPRRFGPPAPVGSDAFFAEPHGPISGTFTPDAGYVADPQLAAQNLGTAVRHHGGTFRLRTRVASIEQTDSHRWRVGTTDGGAIGADVVINAAGPWSAEINRMAGVGGDFAVRSRPLRQEVHEVAAPAGFDRDGNPGVIIADPDLGIYVRSTGRGRILVGGLEPECDPLQWLDDPDVADPRPTPALFQAQVMRAARRLPGLAVPNHPSGIAGVYDAATDWAPIYDRTAADGFFVAMGTSGNQFKNAPVVGLMMSSLVNAVDSGQDHDAEPVRVILPRTGSEIDMSAYSRLRVVEAGAPVTVMG